MPISGIGYHKEPATEFNQLYMELAATNTEHANKRTRFMRKDALEIFNRAKDRYGRSIINHTQLSYGARDNHFPIRIIDVTTSSIRRGDTHKYLVSGRYQTSESSDWHEVGVDVNGAIYQVERDKDGKLISLDAESDIDEKNGFSVIYPHDKKLNDTFVVQQGTSYRVGDDSTLKISELEIPTGLDVNDRKYESILHDDSPIDSQRVDLLSEYYGKIKEMGLKWGKVFQSINFAVNSAPSITI